jgi:hypothetical protein
MLLRKTLRTSGKSRNWEGKDLAPDTGTGIFLLSLSLVILFIIHVLNTQGLAARSTVLPGLKFRNYRTGLNPGATRFSN